MSESNHPGFSPRIYRGVTINRISPSGMYVAFVIGHGRLMADTIDGIKQLIRDALNGVPRGR